MTFCPNCGTALKTTATPIKTPPVQTAQTEQEKKEEKPSKPDKSQKQEKTEHGYVYYLMAGFILVTIGIFSIEDLTTPKINSGQVLAAMLAIIGIIIIIGGIFIATSMRKHTPTNNS